MEFFKCPVSFQQNCMMYEVKCNECAAYTENSSEFFYTPINSKDPNLSFKNHPLIKERKLQRQKAKDQLRKEKTLARKESSFQKQRAVVRKGYKTEKKVLNKISAKSTLASGRINGDADGVLEIISDLKLGIEHKTRLNGRNLLGPTSEEWETAHNQGAKVFIVTSKEKGSIVTLDLDTFNKLIELIEDLVQS